MGLILENKMTREEENAFIIEGAKRELAFYQWLLKDYLLQERSVADIVDCLNLHGLEKANNNINEKHIDFLGVYMGFTLDYNEDIKITFAWAFDENEDYGRTELEIEE